MKQGSEKDLILNKAQSEISPHTLLKKTILGPSVVSLIERILIHPLDTIITFQQKENLNLLHALKHIKRQHGFLGYYRGLSYPLVISAPPAAIIVYGSYEGLKELLSHNSLSIAGNIVISSFLTGLLCSLISTPIEAKRIRDTLGVNTTYLKGLPYYYRGFFCNTSKMLLHAMIVLAGTDILKNKASTLYDDASSSVISHLLDVNHPYTAFLGGLLWGSIAQLVTTPFDAIKTKIMSDYTAKRYSFWEHAKKAYQEKSLSTALGSRMLKLGIHSSVMMGFMSVFNQLFSQDNNNENAGALARK